MKNFWLACSLLGVAWSDPLQFTLPSPWSFVCDSSNSSLGGHYVQPRCIKVDSTSATQVQGLNACKMTCGATGMVWPKPVFMDRSDDLIHFIPQELKFFSIATGSDEVSLLVNKFADIFKEYLYMKNPGYEGDYVNPFQDQPFTATNQIMVSVEVEAADSSFTTETDESYSLEIKPMVGKRSQDSIHVSISAATYYGARHAMETLSQMIGYDDPSDTLLIYRTAKVEDRPAFKHRGLLLDTSRNFMTVQVIKQIISAMSYDKLNVFHWHITDTHSFPMYSRRVPQLTLYGAYSPRKVYSIEDIQDIIEFAKVRGVRVLPEFDAPAHVGNGWQFGEKEGQGRLALCVNQEPWEQFCVEPPCGQLNPINQNVYTTLGKLYEDFFEMFQSDLFHMGGDEVNLGCWNASAEIRDYFDETGKSGTEEDLIQLWDQFQQQAAEKVYSAAGKRVPLILWTSRLTKEGEVDKYLNKDDYIIQLWTNGNSPVVSELINKGFRVIFSPSDAWYLDCGYGAWVGEGNNWCSPYKGWQVVYDSSPRASYRNQGGDPANEYLILGGEAAMWSEQVDSAAVMHKLWPRASALAERLWSDPASNWKQAEIRLVSHRENMVMRGVTADGVQPEWCNQNEGLCYLSKKDQA